MAWRYWIIDLFFSGVLHYTETPLITIVDEGSVLNLTCSVNGSEPLKYSWTKDAHIFESMGGKISVPSLSRSHTGSYVCTVVNMYGEKQSSARKIVVRCEYIVKLSQFRPDKPRRLPMWNIVSIVCKRAQEMYFLPTAWYTRPYANIQVNQSQILRAPSVFYLFGYSSLILCLLFCIPIMGKVVQVNSLMDARFLNIWAS